MFAQIYFDICGRCRELGEGSWSWWFAGCWQFTCSPQDGGVVALAAANLAVAGYAGVQLWAATKQPKA
jgi:hypothetical protein